MDLKKFLPDILGNITGIGQGMIARALADVRAQVDAAAALRAADLVARAIFKGLGAVAHPLTGLSLEQRTVAIRGLAAVVNGACIGLGNAVLKFGEAQAVREAARGNREQEAAALLAREAAEVEITADLRDIALLATGRAPHDTD